MIKTLDPYFKSEYEIHCFGFSCEQMRTELRQFYDEQIELLTNEVVESAIESVPNKMKENSIELKSKISKELIDSISKSSDKGFKKIDNFIDKVFSIPDNVLLLDHYQSGAYTDKNDEALEAEFKRLDKIYKQNLQMMNIMDYELDLYKQLESTISQEQTVANIINQSLKNKTNTVESQKIMATIKEIFNED